MNQRVRRASKRNKLNQSTFATGGHVTQHSREEAPQVRAPKPQRATGEMPDPLGFAKASPLAKKIKDVVSPKSKQEEKAAIKKATIEEVSKKKQTNDKDED